MMNFSTDTYRPEVLWTRWLVYWHTEMIPHLRRNWLSWGGLVGAILLFNAFFTLAITVTQSLPSFDSIRLPGLMSRWITPRPWA